MQAGTLVVKNVTPQTRKKFTARVVRVVNGQEGSPHTLLLEVKKGKAMDQHGKFHDLSLFEQYMS